jgi:MFS family permease
MHFRLDPASAVPNTARTTIFLAFFANGFLSTCWVVHIPRIRSLLGLSDGELGLILWAGTLGLFLGMTLGGWWPMPAAHFELNAAKPASD